MKIPKKVNLQPVNTEAVITAAANDAQALVAGGFETELSDISMMDETATGATFAIDVLLPEGVETGDSREFDLDSVDIRQLPLPLLWQVSTAERHFSSVIVGRIDYVERIGDTPAPAPDPIDEADSVAEITTDTPDDGLMPHESPVKGLGNVVGVFDTGVWGREAERLVRGGFLRGVSADLDKFEASVEELADESDEGSDTIKNEKIKISGARLMGATLVALPAFEECVIRIVDDAPEMYEEEFDMPLEDGIYEEVTDDAEFQAAAITASIAPVTPPRNWYDNPNLKSPTPITVSDEGQVFGHIAAWHVDHIGLPRATKPPRSFSNYAHFRTGVIRTDDGTDVPVGQLTLAGGHASMTATASQAVKHYDDTASAIADVTVGEDKFGIWVAGSIRPDATPAQIRALRASAPSGDWRPINGRLELVAVCQVNVPGFPVTRAMVAGGQMYALVAAGARPLAELREAPVQSLAARLDTIEQEEFARKREAALAMISPLKEERDAALVASAQKAREAVDLLAQERNAELAQKAAIAREKLFGSI